MYAFRMFHRIGLSWFQRMRLRRLFDAYAGIPESVFHAAGIQAASSLQFTPKVGDLPKKETVRPPEVYVINKKLELRHSLVESVLQLFVQRHQQQITSGVITTGEYWTLKVLKKAFK